jgi:hypothetical protein
MKRMKMIEEKMKQREKKNVAVLIFHKFNVLLKTGTYHFI